MIERKIHPKVLKYLDLARKLKKAVEYEGVGDINYSWWT